MGKTRHAWRGWIAVGFVALLAAAASWAQFSRSSVGKSVEFDLLVDRFQQVKGDLSPEGVVCYLSDADVQTERGTFYYYLAEYSVAPVVLRASADCKVTMGYFVKAQAASAIIAQHGLEIVRDYGAGLMVLRRKRP